jgi:hypothetical protein
MSDPTDPEKSYWYQLQEGREGILHPKRARRLFFEAVDRLEPDVRDSLKRDVFPHFEAMLSALRERGAFAERGDLTWGRPIEESDTYKMLQRIVELDLRERLGQSPKRPELAGYRWQPGEGSVLLDQFVEWYWHAAAASEPAVEILQGALDGWANTYDINTRWVIETALRTMCVWRGLPVRPGSEGGWLIPEPVNFEARHALPRDEERDYMELPDLYDLSVRTRAETKSHYQERFAELLDARLDYLEALATEHAIETIPKRLRGGQDHHPDWLARVLVCGRSLSQVAADVHKDIKTVREAVHPLALYLGFTLRLSRGGRPTGS